MSHTDDTRTYEHLLGAITPTCNSMNHIERARISDIDGRGHYIVQGVAAVGVMGQSR